MSKRYSGALITKTPVVPTSLSAPGIWSLSDQAAAQATNTWPFPRDPQFKNVTMLLHGDGSAGPVSATGVGAGVSTTVTNFNADASTNNFNVTINGDARSDRFTPYQAGYYSNYFNGVVSANQSLTASPTAVGTSNFTVEFWFYYLGVNSDSSDQQIYDTGTNGFSVYISGGSVGVYNRVASSAIFSTVAITANSWVHIAFVRSGTGASQTVLYVNGTSSATATLSTNFTSTTATIGGRFAVSGASWNTVNGYVSNVRYNNTAVYSGAFTPSTTPLTAISGTVLLTCQSNRFVDNSASPLTITVNGTPQVSPAIPFTLPTTVATYGSGYFDGTGDYLTQLTATTALNLSSGDWSISFWVYKTATANGSIVNLYNSAGNTSGLSIWIGSGGVKVDNGVSGGVQAGTVVVNAWSYIEVIRSSGTTTIYVNGVSAGTTTQTPNASQFGSFGSAADGTLPHQGYITDLRIVKGTALSSSVPTSPVTAVTNTSLLTTQYNGGGNNSGFKDSSQFNFPITRNGNTTQGTFTPYGSNWSNYFNGTDAYWKQASSTNYTFGTNDFTIECWINLNSTSTNMRRIFGIGYGANGGSHGGTWDFRYQGTEASGQISLGRYDGSTDTLFTTSGATITVNTWTHVAVSRTGGNLRIFVDGVAYYNAANTTNFSVVTYGGNTELWCGLGYYGPAGGLGGPRYFGGYMSNIRIINGTGIYSSTFTPSTTPLTAITSTQLLTAQSNRFVDNSTNAQAITTGGSPTVQRFSPFAPLTVYNPTTYGGSAYFNGSTSYLTAASNPPFAFGTGDFTIELWYYFSATTGSNQHLVDMRGGSSGTTAPLLYVSTSNVIIFYTNGSNQIANTTLSVGSWYHIALTRSGTTTRLFVNGVLSGSVADTNSYVQSSVFLGRASDSAGGYVNGFECDARILKGTAQYTSAFTPPTAPLTAITNTSLLLNMTNAGILDNAMMNDLETVGNAQISTSVKKYGAASMYFDGSGDYLYINPSNNLPFLYGSGDFTVEAFIYPTGVSGYQYICSVWGIVGQSDATYSSWQLRTNSANLEVVLQSGGTTTAITGSGTSLTANTWQHVAVSRGSNTVKLFINGTQVASQAYSSTLNSPASAFVVGVQLSNNNTFTGYIDDLRITKGVARYTANFTAPDQAFPNG
jgi:hypothetical protein